MSRSVTFPNGNFSKISAKLVLLSPGSSASVLLRRLWIAEDMQETAEEIKNFHQFY